MRKLILSTIHPAPYFDRLVVFLRKKNWEVETWYNMYSTNEKSWKKYCPQNVHLYSEKNIWQKARHFANADFVILAWGSSENVWLGILIKILGGRFAFYLDHPDPQKTKDHGISYLIKKCLMRFADFMYCACYSCMDYLHKTYGINKDKLKIFPYTHSEAPLEIVDINASREQALKNNELVKVLIASRFIQRKGYAVVYKAFKRLYDHDLLKEFDIDIVGNGELYDEYKKKFLAINPNIKFYGWIENEEYENLLNNCDVYLHPSFFEPFGIPPLDAMERNKYVICTDQVKSTDVFLNQQGITIYESNNDEALFNILSAIVSKKSDLYEISCHNDRICKEWYSLDINRKTLASCL